MTICEKLEILIRRKGMKKTEFAEKIGITYRALANYLSGSRRPRKPILLAMATSLGTSVEFLTDNTKGLILNSEERFIFNASSDSRSITEASNYLEQTRGLFAGNALTEMDKQALFACLTEIYFDAKEKALSGEEEEK